MPLKASAVSSRASAPGSPAASAHPRASSASASPSGRLRGHHPPGTVDQLGSLGEIHGRGGPVPGAKRSISRGPVQPERVIAEMPGLGRARGVAQRGGRGAMASGQPGGLLVPPLRLAGQAPGEAQLGQPDRQPIRLGAGLNVASRPAQRGAQLVGDLIERGAPGADVITGRHPESRASVQTPAQVTGQSLDRLACVGRPAAPYCRIVSRTR